MEYTIRKSKRASHVWLKLSDTGELVIVVPQGFDMRRVPGIVAGRSKWIIRTRQRLALTRSAALPAGPVALPSTVVLPAIGREWTVQYKQTTAARVYAVERGDDMLLVSGAVTDVEMCRRALIRWLLRVANRHLPPRLEAIAAAEKLALGRAAVRFQRTRWASCSRSGTISLNLRLLFVAPELVRHIMLHELCHTRCMNHSERFWQLLALHDPDWRDARRRLRRAWLDTPAWLTQPLVPFCK